MDPNSRSKTQIYPVFQKISFCLLIIASFKSPLNDINSNYHEDSAIGLFSAKV